MSEQVNERYRLMALLEALGPQPNTQVVVLDGDPCSKARPRFSKGGWAYTPSKTIEGEKRLAVAFSRVERFSGNVSVACLFYRKTRQRVDVDNMIKAVLDAGTRANLWDDDSQVTAVVGVVEYDQNRPRTAVAFGLHDTTLKRGNDGLTLCIACGKPFQAVGKNHKNAKYCSMACRVTIEPIICPGCGVEFHRRSTRQKTCSMKCRGICQSRRDIARRATRTHCKMGHELVDENVWLAPSGRKRCRRCNADAQLLRRARKAGVP